VLLGEGQIELGHLPPELVPVSPLAEGGGNIDATVKAAEAHAIREALLRNRGSRLASARALGMHKSTFFRKTRQLGITLPEQDGRARRKPEPPES
jgi:transcriptional regulator of acetoin/glycerol metabolism